jgi:hypothetical protein
VAISPLLQPDPTRGSQLHDVAVNASGQAIAAWDQFTYAGSGGASIRAAVQSGGKWGAPITISGTGGFSMSPRVAIGAEGTMAVSWTYQDPTGTQKQVQVAVKAADATNWSTTTLAQTTLGGVSMTEFVPVAVDSFGNVTAAWVLWDGSHHQVQAATLLRGGGSWSTSTLSGADDGLYPALAVNARGDAAVVYSCSPYSAYLTGTSARYVFRIGPSGPWSPPTTTSETIPSSVGYVQYPQVALDANGLATVIYSGYGIEAVRQRSDGTWTTPQSILYTSTLSSSYTSFDLAMDDSGNAIAAASIFDATINVDRASIWVSRGTPDGKWSPQLRLTDPSVPIDAYAAQAAISPDGSLALVGWIDHYHGTVQVSKLTSGNWSAANTVGRGTAWASFQEVLALDAASATVARATWKNAKSGTQVMATSYGR